MTAKEVLRCIRRRAKARGLDVQLTEGRGSHKKVTVGGCVTTVPFHAGEGIGRGSPTGHRARSWAMSRGEVVTVSVYRAVVRRDEDGYWFADFPDVPGCHTQAKTREQLRARMRDALDLFVPDADTALITEDLRLPDRHLTKLVRKSGQLRSRAQDLDRQSRAATSEAANALISSGFSLRAAAEVLEISYQRVHQVLRAEGGGQSG